MIICNQATYLSAYFQLQITDLPSQVLVDNRIMYPLPKDEIDERASWRPQRFISSYLVTQTKAFCPAIPRVSDPLSSTCLLCSPFQTLMFQELLENVMSHDPVQRTYLQFKRQMTFGRPAVVLCHKALTRIRFKILSLKQSLKLED